MRTINFNEMALLNGGQAVSVAAPTTNLTFDDGLSRARRNAGCGVTGLTVGFSVAWIPIAAALLGGLATLGCILTVPYDGEK